MARKPVKENQSESATCVLVTETRRICPALATGILGFLFGYLPHHWQNQKQFVEPSGVGADLVFDVTKIFSVQSKYQKIDVLKSKFFGYILTIDDDLMLTERDEFLSNLLQQNRARFNLGVCSLSCNVL